MGGDIKNIMLKKLRKLFPTNPKCFKIKNGVLKKYIEEPWVKKAVIPDNVTSIGDGAFQFCKYLTTVIIPENVTSIGNVAFSYCEKLTSVVIPDSVTSIGESAFRYCENLTSLVIGSGVTNIGDHVFSGCESLTSLVLSCGVTSIGDWAFSFCRSMTSLVIPDSVTSIGNRAFCECESLTSLVIPESVTSIGDRAFCECKGLTSLVIPDSVKSIADDAFWGCCNVKKLPLFGYFVDGTKINFKKVQLLDVQAMLKYRNYDIQMEENTKFQIVTQVFIKDRQTEAENYIKKNITKIFSYFFHINDYDTVKSLLESEKLVTEQNIMELIDCAIEHTQNGGDVQIQVLLMNYKNDKFPDIDPFDSMMI